MWSFDEENNNGTTPEGNGGENNRGDNNGYGNNGGNNYDGYGYNNNNNGYNDYNSYNGGGYNSGNGPKKNPSPKKGLIPAVLLCVVVFAATLMIGYTMGGGKLSLGGAGVETTTVPTTDTSGAADGTQSTDETTDVVTDITTQTTTAITAPSASGVSSGATEGKIQSVAEKCLNASVLITVTTNSGAGSGSGVIYTTDGYILTNYHVVGSDATSITVTMFDGKEYDAAFVYGDESLDVSVIKIDKNDCTAVEICKDSLDYGEQIIVIGNSLGNGFTLTSGYVSAPEREVTFSSTYETMTLIQIDAAVNNGNSGGGLFNTAGQLVGIVNAKLSGTTSSGASIDNIGFAIPMSTVLRCVNDLKEYGYVTGVARLGIAVQNYLELPNGYKYSGYNVIYSLVPEGSAALAGLQEGDILYAINGQVIDSYSTLKQMLTAYSVGDTIKITVYRPNGNALQTSNVQFYLRNCDEVTLDVTFVEFNPNA